MIIIINNIKYINTHINIINNYYINSIEENFFFNYKILVFMS